MNDRINQIKEALRQIVQQIVQSGQPISPEVRQLLNQAIGHAESRISQLRAEQPIPAGADQLWVLAGGNPAAFQSYMGNVPNAALNLESQDPGRVSNIENRLGDKITLPAGESQAGVPKAQLNSSNVYGFAYDPTSATLRVRFQGGGMYEYDKVPPRIFKAFQAGAIPARTNGQNQYGRWWVGKNPSLGASFFNLIRDRYQYQKVA